MKKRIIGRGVRIGACILLAFVLLAVQVSGAGRQWKARHCFARNEAMLLALAERFDAGERAGLDARELRGVKCMSVHANPDYLQFHTGAFGLAPSSVYSGFYYSAQDEPIAPDRKAALEPVKNGWRWQGEGDNRGYVCRIRENWFYFEDCF